MFQLAGVDLMVPTPEIRDIINRWIDPDLFVPWLRRSWPGFGQVGIAYPTGIRDIWIDYRRVKINKFYWPTGASRWAFGHFLVSAKQVDLIRQEAYPGGTGFVTVPFKLSCPGQASVEKLNTDLYVLACTPIGGLTGYGDFTKTNPPYLITVVDDRYYWWYKSTPDFVIDDTTTWLGLLGQLSASSGIGPIIDTIDPAYLQPSRGLYIPYETVPQVLDAICYNIGHRFVRGFDGTMSTQSFQTAKTSLQNDFAAYPLRSVRAGGSRFLDAL